MLLQQGKVLPLDEQRQRCLPRDRAQVITFAEWAARGQMVMQGTIGPEVDGGSQDMRETWMLLEYADRGNLDRALVQKKMMTADNCLDLVSAPGAACQPHSMQR